jgi:hypothetical protein
MQGSPPGTMECTKPCFQRIFSLAVNGLYPGHWTNDYRAWREVCNTAGGISSDHWDGPVHRPFYGSSFSAIRPSILGSFERAFDGPDAVNLQPVPTIRLTVWRAESGALQ